MGNAGLAQTLEMEGEGRSLHTKSPWECQSVSTVFPPSDDEEMLPQPSKLLPSTTQHERKHWAPGQRHQLSQSKVSRTSSAKSLGVVDPPVRKSREDLHLDIPQSSLEGLERTFLQESGTSESFGFYWVLSLAASFDLRYCEHFNRLYYIFSLFVGNSGTNFKLSAIMALDIMVCTHMFWLYPRLPLIFPQIFFLQLLFTPLHSVLLQATSNPFRNESANAEIQWMLKKIHSHPTLWEDNAASQTQFWRLLWWVTTLVTLGKLLDNSKLPFPPF